MFLKAFSSLLRETSRIMNEDRWLKSHSGYVCDKCLAPMGYLICIHGVEFPECIECGWKAPYKTPMMNEETGIPMTSRPKGCLLVTSGGNLMHSTSERCRICLGTIWLDAKEGYAKCEECGGYGDENLIIEVPSGALWVTQGIAFDVVKGAQCVECFGQMQYEGRGWQCLECGCRRGFGPDDRSTSPPEGTLWTLTGEEVLLLAGEVPER